MGDQDRVSPFDGLWLGEAAILGHLDRSGPQTTADLVQRRGVSHRSTANSVTVVLGGGLVRAEPHPTDGRKLLLHVTEDGRAPPARTRSAHRFAQRRCRRGTQPGRAASPARLRPLLARLAAHFTGR
ncbi:MarR family transcriptional regulator [Streptomyces sp. NPDC006552]|uniref:MarR family transcriptional regulator n=1 Tax=Streptomyces sp. NPDC006552 TaxID=3157179 RepID=UPI0033BEA960